MEKEAAEADSHVIKQNLSAFNDKLIQKMRVFFSQEPIAHPAPNPPTPPRSQPPSLQTPGRVKEVDVASKRHSLSTNISLTEAACRGAIPFGLFAPDQPPNLSQDFDTSGTRRWEHTLCANGQLPPNLLRDSEFVLSGIKEDLLTDDFSGKFESDSEQQAERTIELPAATKGDQLSFLSYAQSAGTAFSGSSLFSLKNLIERLENRNLRFRRYECDQCHRKFYNPAALGGHKSKQHPKSSKRYNERKNTYSLRTGERRKRTFLNNL